MFEEIKKQATSRGMIALIEELENGELINNTDVLFRAVCNSYKTGEHKQKAKIKHEFKQNIKYLKKFFIKTSFLPE